MEQPDIAILYVEDDESLSYVTADNLERKGYAITRCVDGVEAWEHFQNNHYDCCIIDVMLPGIDGFELATRIRKVNTDIPIIFLTARTMKEDKIKGLKLGADDYLTKPFSIEELELKIEIFLSRSKKDDSNNKPLAPVKIGNSSFDPVNNIIVFNQKKQKLTVRESELLFCLVNNKNSVVSREEILEKVWKNSDFFISRSLDVFISRLRKYINDDPAIRIENVHGVGFRLLEK